MKRLYSFLFVCLVSVAPALIAHDGCCPTDDTVQAQQHEPTVPVEQSVEETNEGTHEQPDLDALLAELEADND
jgi:hypothetical protein